MENKKVEINGQIFDIHEFKIIKDCNLIKSINCHGKVFHVIDENYINDGIIVHSWINYRTNEQVKKVLDGHFFERLQQLKCKKSLIDLSKMAGSFSGVNIWYEEYFIPKMIRIGLRATAVVFPADIYPQLARFENVYNDLGIISYNFNKFKIAIEWLRKITLK